MQHLTISSIGLIVDIIGATLVFFFSISPTLFDQENEVLDLTPLSPARIRRNRTYRMLTKLGYVLLILGFLGQFIGSLR